MFDKNRIIFIIQLALPFDMVSYLLVIGGIALLIKGADWLVSGSSSLARGMGISNMVIGLTIVSFGTSLPELIINIISSLNGNSQIAVGNVMGSNIANVLLILGIAAIIYPLKVHRQTVVSEIPFSLAAALLLGFLANADLFKEGKSLSISTIDGVVMLFFFLLFMAYIFKLTKSEDVEEEKEGGTKVFSKKKSWILIALGVPALFAGGEMTVRGAVEIAEGLGFSEAFIGLTVIAIGTSLPELVTSAIAASKKESDLAIGNVVGSNIFNILWILGLSSVINPLPFQVTGNSDILMILISTTMIILVLPLSRKNQIERWHGVLFLLIYGSYIYYLTLRG